MWVGNSHRLCIVFMLVWFTPRERRGFEGPGITGLLALLEEPSTEDILFKFVFLSSSSYPRSSQNLQRLTLTWPASCRCRASSRRHSCTINTPFGESITPSDPAFLLSSFHPSFLPPPFLPPPFLPPFLSLFPHLSFPILLIAWESCVNLVIYNMLLFVTL